MDKVLSTFISLQFSHLNKNKCAFLLTKRKFHIKSRKPYRLPQIERNYQKKYSESKMIYLILANF